MKYSHHFSLQEVAGRIGSQHSSGWKGPQEGSSPTSCLKQSALGSDQVAQGFIRAHLGNLQGCRQHNLSGQPGALLGFPHGGKKALSARFSSLYRSFLTPHFGGICKFQQRVFCHLFHGLDKDVKQGRSQDRFLQCFTCHRHAESATYLPSPCEFGHPAIFFSPSFQTVVT